MVSVGDSLRTGLIADAAEVAKTARGFVSEVKPATNPELLSAPVSNEDQFGRFSDDAFRLEAVRIRERRLLIHGVMQQCVRPALWICLTVLLLSTDRAVELGGRFLGLLALS